MENNPEDLPQAEKQNKSLFSIGSVIGVIILLGVVILGVLYLKSPKKNPSVVDTTPSPMVTQAPIASIANSEITFEVLNGSGVNGQAASYGKQLETLGYQVKLLGNAEGEPVGLSVYTAESLISQKDTLMADLKKEFPTASYSGVLKDSTNMVRLIIGK
jgi:hypothetical protein